MPKRRIGGLVRRWPQSRRWLGAAAHVVATALAYVVLRLLRLAGGYGDVLSVGLPLVAVALFVLALAVAVFWWRWGLRIGLMALVVVVQIVMPRLPSGTGDPHQPVRLLAANLLYDNELADRAVDDILEIDADVLVISELTAPVWNRLGAVYPHQVITSSVEYSAFGQGVFSKYPMTEIPLIEELDFHSIRVRVDAPTPFVLYGIHLPRPVVTGTDPPGLITFGDHLELVETLDASADADGAGDPVVIAGDLNVSDRTRGYGVLASDRVDVGATQFARSTFAPSGLWRLLMLRIDYIFVPDDWCVTAVDTPALIGSDHRAVTADIGACA